MIHSLALSEVQQRMYSHGFQNLGGNFSWVSGLPDLMTSPNQELQHKSPHVDYISQLELNGPQTYGIVFCIFQHMDSFSHFKSTENEKIIFKSSWRINYQEMCLIYINICGGEMMRSDTLQRHVSY